MADRDGMGRKKNKIWNIHDNLIDRFATKEVANVIKRFDDFTKDKKDKDVLNNLELFKDQITEEEYGTIEQYIRNGLNETTAGILGGIANLNRLSLEEEQGRRKGGKRNVEASIILSADARTNGKEVPDEGTGSKGDSGRGTGQHSGERISQHTLSTHQENVLKEYAQETGI